MKTLSRQELYDAVWSRPITELAKEFGVSEYIIWNACKKHNIPRPGMHYWHKLKRGAKLEKTPLPPSQFSGQIEIAYHPFRPGPRIDPTQPPSALKGKSLDDLEITFRDSVAKAHKLVRATKANLSSYTNFRGCVQAVGREPHLWIEVSKATLTRALLLLDAIVRGLETLGFKMAFRIQTASKTYAWSDEPDNPLEKRVKFLINQILITADKMMEHSRRLEEFHRRMDEERKRVEEARRILEQQQAEARRRQEQEQLRRQKLEQAADNWDRAQRINHFMDECEKRIDMNASAAPAAFMTWARSHAKRLDPFENDYLPNAIAEFAQAKTAPANPSAAGTQGEASR